MVGVCKGFSLILGGACIFSSVYWTPWLYYWGTSARKSPPPHLFNLVIFLLLLFNIGENAFEASYFFTNKPDSLLYFYLVISAIKQAWNLAYLFPIVRGYLITYQPQEAKTSTELWYALVVAFVYSLLQVLINLLSVWSEIANMWLTALTQLFLITLQLYYAAETLERGESAMQQASPQSECEADTRLRKLRAVIVVLLVQFMKLIYSILAMMDIQDVYGACAKLPIDFLYVLIDLAINSFAMRQVWPQKKKLDEVIWLPL